MKAILCAIVTMGIASGPALAQTPTQQTTLAQSEARGEARWMAADTDHDGRISAAEWQAAMTGKHGDPARHFARLDRNQDGFVDKSEIDDALARRFRRMDTNADGTLSPQERQAAHAAHRNGAAKGA